VRKLGLTYGSKTVVRVERALNVSRLRGMLAPTAPLLRGCRDALQLIVWRAALLAGSRYVPIHQQAHSTAMTDICLAAQSVLGCAATAPWTLPIAASTRPSWAFRKSALNLTFPLRLSLEMPLRCRFPAEASGQGA
jgi:hypothetical protein